MTAGRSRITVVSIALLAGAAAAALAVRSASPVSVPLVKDNAPLVQDSAPRVSGESVRAGAGSGVRPFNIAAAALGGRVELVTSQRDAERWAGANVIDGGASHAACSPLCAWASEGEDLPQELVLSFAGGREALVGRVVVDTATPVSRQQAVGVPREIELWSSTTSASEGFVRIAATHLPPEVRRHAIDIAPTRLRYLKVRVLSRHGGRGTVIGEVGVYEAAAAPSILADVPRNLAAPALGGALVSFTSEFASFRASHVIDGDPATTWRSDSEHLPQEFVFAFHEDRTAFIDRVVLHVRDGAAGRPKTVAITGSLATPAKGFEEFGRFTLEDRPGAHALPVGRHARFLKVRLLERAQEGRLLTSLGEIEIFEGTAPGYQSVFFRHAEGPTGTAGMRPAATTVDSVPEHEPNDTIPMAGRLAPGQEVSGAVDASDDVDHYRLAVSGSGMSVVTVELAGDPYIRFSLDLLDGDNKIVKRFDPARAPGAQETISWLVPAGDYTVRIAQPPASVVLVWDTSGSMKGREDDLRRAVEGYLDALPPGQHVNLVRFSHDIEVLLPEFSSDRGRLKAASAGKFYARGATPLYDAIAAALRLLDGRGGNRAIVLMTDGDDAGSGVKREALWPLLQDRGVRLHTVGLGDLDRYNLQLGSSGRRLLGHLALATGGRSYFTADPAGLGAFYREIAEEMRSAARYRVSAAASQAKGTLAVNASVEERRLAASARIELILDASGSMKRRIGGRTMIDAAKDVLGRVVDGLPEDAHVALRVYGHRVREGAPGACEDSQLVSPFAKVNKKRLKARLARIEALGTTPLAYSLGQVARDMGGAPGEKVIVLVTDGKEECGGDPAAAVRSLASAGIDARLNVVGFALADETLKADLRRLAGQTAGAFVDAQDAGSLQSAIERSLGAPYDVLDAAGTRVGGGLTGDTIEVPQGIYTVAIHPAERPVEVSGVRIRAGEVTSIELRRDGRELTASLGLK